MPNYNDVGTAIRQLNDSNVTNKTAINSISPLDVGGVTNAFVNAVIPILNTINEFAVFGGSIPPVNSQGNDLDMYFEFGVSEIRVYKKRNGAWEYNAGGAIGMTFVDGNISLQTSISGDTVTVSAGQWIRNNVRYATTSQEQFTVPTADLNFERRDLIYASDDETVSYLAGVASSTPTPPAIPVDAVLVDYVNVPSLSSGIAPYLFDSNPQSVFAMEMTAGSGNPNDANGKDGDVYLKNTGTVLSFYQKSGGTWGSSITDFAGGGGGGIPEAPVDGKTYGRKDATWSEVVLFLPTQQTGYEVSFDAPYVYNTYTVTGSESSPITFDFTDAKFGQVQKMYHNSLYPISGYLPSQAEKMGNGVYMPGELNVVYFEYVSNTRVEYWVTQGG